MRLALVGWDLDDALASALAPLGLDVVAFSRWHEGQPLRQRRDGWVEECCPHRLGGGPLGEAFAFRDSVAGRDAEYGLGAGGYDVVHALDAMATPAALALADRREGTARVASISASDLTLVDALAGSFEPECWVASHPWNAARWMAQRPSAACRTFVVPQAPIVATRDPGPRPRLAFWLPAGTWVDTAAIRSALEALDAELPELTVFVGGSSRCADVLRAVLRPLGVRENGAHSSALQWNQDVALADVVGTAGRNPTDDPAAWLAWSAGSGVIRIDGRSAESLATAFRSVLFGGPEHERTLRAAREFARRQLEPASVAAAWMKLYLDAREGRGRRTVEAAAPTPRALQANRTRLDLDVVSTREALASWHIHPADWRSALAWLGPDAPRASLVLRLHDITDLEFHGLNAHHVDDITLRPDESQRALRFDRPGRSLVASLGIRSPRGAFLALAQTAPTHLPRDADAPRQPVHRLRALARR